MNDRFQPFLAFAEPIFVRIPAAFAWALVALLGWVGQSANAHQVGAAPMWVVGAPNMAPAGTLTVAWPGVNPEVVARSVAAAPAGSRGLLLTGFADDIAARDTLSTVRVSKGRRATIAVASPWFDAGASAVRSRAAAWLGRFAAAGGSADFIVIRCNASASVQRFGSSWNAIAADPRGAALLRELGVRDLSARTVGASGFASRWKATIDACLTAALTASIGAELQARFPRATIVLQAPSINPSASAAFGSAALRSLSATDLAGTTSLDAALNRLAPDSRWAVSLPEPSSRAPVAPGDRAIDWREAAFHAALRTRAPMLVGAPTLASTDIAEVLAVARDLRSQSVDRGSTVPVRLTDVTYGPGIMLASAARVGDAMLVRVSTEPGVREICLSFAGGGTASSTLIGDESGVWVRIGSRDRLMRVEACISAGPEAATTAVASAQSAPAWTVLFDSIPADGATAPVSGARPYMLVGQYDCDPEIARTGVIDPERVAAQVDRLIAAGKGSEFGVLDFEEPFDHLWESGASDPRYGPALQSMIATIRFLKQRYPGIKWTYYGLPRVKYWLPEGEWAELSQAQREAVYARSVAPILPLMGEMDWFNPGVYDVYERSMGMPTTRTPRIAAEAAWRSANVETIKWHFASRGAQCPPVIPMVCPWFQGGGFATEMRPVPSTEFFEEQVRPLVAAGASGIAIWGGMRYALYVVRWTDPHPSQAFIELRSRIRLAFIRDYLGGQPVQDSEWGDPVLAATIGRGLNETMVTALNAVDAARP